MLRTTTLLIVMALAVGPTGSFACVLWCSTPAADAHRRAVGCHDASPAAPTGRQIASVAGCHDAAAIAPFLTEARQAESGYSASVAASPALGQSRPTVHDRDGIAAAWPVFNAEQPRAPSSRPVLRV